MTPDTLLTFMLGLLAGFLLGSIFYYYERRRRIEYEDIIDKTIERLTDNDKDWEWH